MQTVKMHKGQMYEYVGLVDFKKANGDVIQLHGWFTHCAECGAPMLARMANMDDSPSRRCREHVKRGVSP